MVLAFGDHRIDIERRELRRGTELIDVEPKVFDLLVFLLQHRDRVVSKDDLLQAIWGGRIVSESALTTRINAARRALGDDGSAQRLIRTFTRKGVRFIGTVTETPDQSAPAESGAIDADARLGADKPSIAVLPFQNMSGDPEQEYFVDGMVEEIITALSRIRWLFVIARNSTLTYKGQAVDVKQVGRELGVRYVLEGSVRKAGNQVRIAGQLIDAATGAHLWADRFDGSLEDVFDIQDRVASSVAGIIEPALQAAETARSASRPTSDLTAYDLYLRAYAMFLSSARQIPEALRLMEQAIVRDPRYGPALAWAAICCFRLLLDDRSEDPAAHRANGADFARRALEGADDDPGVMVKCRPRAGLFRRGHRRHDGAGRPRPRAEPELRAWLAHRRRFSGCGRASPTPRSSISMPHCASVPARVSAHRPMSSVSRISLPAALIRRCRSCCWRSRTIPAFQARIAFSPPATPIWGGSTMPAPSSRGCARSRPS